MNLGKSVLRQYKRILNEVGSDIEIIYKGTERCQGAFNSLGEYDIYKDNLYHIENPDAPLCDNGFINGTKVIVKGTLYDRYSTFDDKYSIISHLNDKEYLLMVLPDVSVENIDYIIVNRKKYTVLDTKVRFDDNTEELKYLKLVEIE